MQLTWGDQRLRVRALVALGTVLVAGFLASTALGMVAEAGSGPDATTVTDVSTATTNTGETSPTPTTTDTTESPAPSAPPPTLAPTPASSPTLATSKQTYVPGETVAISGTGWTPAGSVHLHVADTGGNSWSYDKDLAAAADGTIQDSFALPTSFAAGFAISATDSLGLSASTSFSDAFAAVVGPSAIVSDKADYNPGAPVTLTGTGWQPLERVQVLVNDDVGQTWSHEADANADADGKFTVQFVLPDWFVADYSVTATGSAGGTATTAFSDSAVQNVTVAVSPTTAGASAAYTIRFTPTNAVPAGDFIQVTFPAGTTVPASIAAANITVNGTAAPAGSVSTNPNQRMVQFDSQTALPTGSQATVVIGATSPVIGNPAAGTYTLQVKTKDDNNQVTSANYTIVSIKPTATALASSANPSTYPGSVTFTATVTATPTPNPNGVGTVTFKDGATTLCNAVALSSNAATCAPAAVLSAGSHTITADYSGAPNFAPSSGSLTQAVNKGSQTIAFPQPASPAAYGTSFAISATASSGLAVAIGVTGPCSYNGSLGTVTMTAGSGTCAITASQPGNDNYNAAAPVTRNVEAAKANQTISVATHAPSSAAYDSSFSVAATASSGLAVSFSSAGSCSNSGAAFTMTSGSGTCTVKYDQAGDANYNAAARVTEFVSASKANQTIAVTTHAPATAQYNSSFTVAATGGGSQSPVTFSSAGSCSNSGATFTMTNGSGTCTVKYDQAGDANYNAAPQLSESVDAAKADQTVHIATPAPASAAYDSSFVVAATATSGLPVSFSSGGVCSNSGSTFTMNSGTGACAVRYNQPGDANYNAAPQVTESVDASKADQAITFGALGSKSYGDADFAVSATSSSGLAVTFSAFGSCAFSLGQVHLTGAGTCTITASQDGDDNYGPAPAVPQSFDIAKATLTISANDASKVYGEANPPFTGSIQGVVLPDVITLSLDSAATEASNVGTYPIVPHANGSAAVLANYDVQATNGTLTITAKPATVTADDQEKTYGSADPAFTHKTEGLLDGDSLIGVSCDIAAAHTNVGNYDISCAGNSNANYDVSYAKGTLRVNAKPITVKPDAQSKVYGSADPALSYSLTSGSLESGDSFSGSLSREPGESVAGSPYAINPGTLTAGSNYDLTFVDANLTITKAPLTANVSDETKVYGGANPTFTVVSYVDFRLGDGPGAVNGSLQCSSGATNAGGPYNVACSGLTAGDYDISYAGGSLTITTRPITVTAVPNAKVYGSADPALTYQLTSGSLVAGDGFTGALTRESGESVAGSPCPIKQGTMTAGTNYELTFVGAGLSIARRPITVTADAKTKVYGNADPALTYRVTSGSLVTGDGFSGTLTRDAGESVAAGPYAIKQGTLSAGNNYDISYVGANLTITRRPITVTADAKSKILGAADPALTHQVTSGSLATGDGFSGSLTRDTGETVGAYTIRQGTLAAGDNYNLTFATRTLSILYAAATATCLGSPGHTILQPINVDGTSVWKQGSTVPAKFRVCDANGNPVGPTATVPNVVDWFKLMGTVNGIVAPIGEAIDSTTPDTAFRWSSSDQLWIYNISTKNLVANKTYSYRIHLKDGTDIDFKFGLK